jgi:allantoicase
LIGFTREYVVLNGFSFLTSITQQIKNQEYDDVTLGLEISNALMGLEVDTIPFVESIKEVTSIDNIKIHTSMIKKIAKYQEIVDKIVVSSLKLRSDLVSLYLVDDNLNEEDLNKIKKELTKEGMILYLTTEEKYPVNTYKIIHHKNGTKAVIFR